MKLILVLLLLCGAANAADVETMVRLGNTQVGWAQSGSTMLSLTQRVNGRYDFTIGTLGAQEYSKCERSDCVWELDPQVYVGARLLMDPLWFWTDKFKFGIGPTFWAHPDRAVSSFLRINLYLEWRFNEHVGVSAEHFSVNGAGFPLPACNKDNTYCSVRKYNNGQDSWYGLNIYKRF